MNPDTPAAPQSPSRGQRKLMVIDTAYTLAGLRERDQLHTITCRDLNGYFDRVITGHPLVGADTSEPGSIGNAAPQTITLDQRHVVIENPIQRSAGGKINPVTFLRAQLRFLKQLRHIIRSEGISCVRIGDPHYQGLIGMWLKRTTGCKLVLRVGGNADAIHTQTKSLAYPRILPTWRIQKAVERATLHRVDLVLGANQDNLDYAIRNGAGSARTAVCSYGNLLHPAHYLEFDQREPADAHLAARGLSDADPTLVYVGRLHAVKHTDDLVGMLAKIVSRHPKARLLLIGSGPDEKRLRAAFTASKLQDNVVFAGSRSQGYLATVLPACTLAIAPHMGRALAEVALAGLPVVGYDHDWHAELVRTPSHGSLVPLGDIDALADAAAELLDDPMTAARMGERLRRDTLEAMDPARIVAHERNAYAHMLDPDSQAGRDDAKPQGADAPSAPYTPA